MTLGNTVTVEQISKEYDQDEKAADQKYDGKRLTLTGVVDNVFDHGDTEISVHMDVGTAQTWFVAYFDKSYRGKMRKGDTITFEGTIREGGGAKNCKLIGSGGNGGTKGGGTKNGKLTQDELDGMDFEQIMSRLGPPDESYQGNRKKNVKLAVWNSGGGKYITVSYVEAIDRASPTIVMTRNVDRPRDVVENLKRTTANQ